MSTTAVQATPPANGEQRTRQLVDGFPKVPAPKYRHAAPSAPWPWMDFDTDAAHVHPLPTRHPDDSEWGRYPQSLFGNWTNTQVERCEILTKCSDHELSTIYKIRVLNDDDGHAKFDKQVEKRTVRKDDSGNLRAYWSYLRIPPSPNIRVQALFVEDMTLPVLQMLGTIYNIEPFFFASSVNWIPSRYQEDPKPLEDHITVVLPFIRIFKGKQRPITRTVPLRALSFTSTESQSRREVEELPPYAIAKGEQSIDTGVPLPLPENKFLVQDLLSLHMVRKTTTSTIISYHPSLQGTSAKRLRSLAQRTGDSVYWSKIFNRSKDPTFFFLAILWYAIYAWDESFEVLFRYINVLEYDVLESSDLELTRELHKVQAYLSHYQQLLQDFLWSVEFVRDTPNPAMNTPSISEATRKDSSNLLHAEADNLISEIKRLTRQREMLSNRLQNAIHLAFATVTIRDARGMQRLAEVTVKDSTSLKQLAYLTVVFLPATYISNVFSMNIKGILPPDIMDPALGPKETLAHYIESVVIFTLLTSWVSIALQKDSLFYPPNSSMLRRTLWPLYYGYGAISRIKAWFKQCTKRRPAGDSLATSASGEEGIALENMQPDRSKA